MARAMVHCRALLRDNVGQDLIEYALIGSLIAIVAIAAVGNAGTEIDRLWTYIASGLEDIK